MTFEDWAAVIGAVLQEEQVERELDSIERISVRAFLAGKGFNWPNEVALPSTIKEWAKWALQYSADS